MQHLTGGVPMASAGDVSRRSVLRWGGAFGLAALGTSLTSCSAPWQGPGLVLPGAAGALSLLPGFTARVIALGGQRMSVGYEYPIFPDGAATFPDPAVTGGWYHVVNSEVPGGGAVSSIRFAPDGTIVGAQRVLGGTSMNCAGGPTPWGTWLSCEEVEGGYVWECDPTGANPPVRRPALGAFVHEAVAVASDGRIYLTEDRPDGGFYRFTPTSPGDLSAGLLEIATGTAPGPVTWVAVPRPTAAWGATRHQVPGTMRFDGGEGVDTDGTTVWFSTKGDNRIWAYSTASGVVTLRYQAGRPSLLAGVDNLHYDAASDVLLIAEDGDDMQLVALFPDNTVTAVLQVLGHEISEITGPRFSPDGSRLYFSSQRGGSGPLGLPLGVTYEVSGPWDALLGRP